MMKQTKTIKQRLCFLAMLMVVVLTGCSEGGSDSQQSKGGTSGCDGTSGKTTPTEYSGYTRFAAGSPLTRTSMNGTGEFFWANGDNIWVQMDDGSYEAANESRTHIAADKRSADFFVEGSLTADSYKVFYTGQNNSLSTKTGLMVTIPAEQVQTVPNNSDHFSVAGDCGVATATRQADGNYTFELEHKAAYLLFRPKLSKKPEHTRWIKALNIKVEKLDAEGHLRGTYNFDENGLNTTGNVHNPGKTITITSNSDAFDINESDNDINKCGVFAVIEPGTHKLRITYTLAHYTIQDPWYNTTATGDYDANTWYYNYHDEVQTNVFELPAHTFEANTYTPINHVLTIKEPDLVYNFNRDYYMWDAQDWYWSCRDLTSDPWNFPRYNKVYTTEDIPAEGDAAWYRLTARRTSKTDYPTEAEMEDAAAKNKCKDMPNANEMTYYLVYGDPHFDNETTWLLENFHDGHTLCRGGVWIKKKSVIEAEGHTFSKTLSAPFPNNSATSGASALHGNRYDLRKQAPWHNFRQVYTDGKPANTNDYFFLPCLGMYEYTNTTGCTLKLVGVRGYFWTSTPLMTNDGDTKYFEWQIAYYLQIFNGEEKNTTLRYLALSWQDYNMVNGVRYLFHGKRNGYIAGKHFGKHVTEAEAESWFK